MYITFCGAPPHFTGVAGMDLGALGAWSTTQGSANVSVAVVDSGAVMDHPDLAANLRAAGARNFMPGPDDTVDQMAVALDAAGLAYGRAGESALEAMLTIVPVGVVKGLEMDGVIVVEPTAMYESPDVGPRGVYVALTRPTQRLVVVHSRELPRELRD